MALYGDGSNVNKTTDATASTTFGSANAYPLITVDGNQRIRAINNQAISLNAAINANASVGDIGTYAILQQANTNDAVNPGATAAGSTLRYSDSTGRMSGTPSGPSGNWRCMGYDSGAPLVNSQANASASASASGNTSGTLQGGEVQGNASLQGGEVQGNTNANGNLSVNLNGPHKGGISVGNPINSSVSTSGLNVGGNVGTSGLNVAGNVSGTASINVSVNSVSVNMEVAYSSTLWLRYA